jgi:hypothetical protein
MAGGPSAALSDPSGGRTWWAHLDFTRINIELTILRKKIEELLENSRSWPVLLRISDFRAHRPVSRSR